MTTQSLQPMDQAAPSIMQSFLLEIFLSGMIVDVFLTTENLRNTAVQQNHAKPLYDPKLWIYKEKERGREREREIKTLGPHCHAISSISDGTRRAPKQALRLRFCEELCPRKQQNDGEMTETECTRTGRKTRCHPGMLFIVTRDRGGRDDVMRKSPISRQMLNFGGLFRQLLHAFV